MNSGGTSFNLIDEPWIPVTSGARSDVYSINDLFEKADTLGAVTGDVPAQTLALYRLLIAILHSAVKPVSGLPAARWKALWDGDENVTETVRAYLDRPEVHSRFDLLDPEKPFYQMPGMVPAAEDAPSSGNLPNLVQDLPSGTQSLTTFTNRRKAALTPMSFAEAARWLVHGQAGDTKGVKSAMKDQAGARSGRLYAAPGTEGWLLKLSGFIVEGRNLRETLLLNLVLGDVEQPNQVSSAADDKPAWERPHATNYPDLKNPRVPNGPIDVATWQQRRILLEEQNGAIVSARLTYGDPLLILHGQTGYEPNTVWRRRESDAKEEFMPTFNPVGHGLDRSLWRGLTASLLNTTGLNGSASGSGVIRPAVLRWIDRLQMRRVLAGDYQLRIRSLGAIPKNDMNFTVIVDDVDDSLPFTAATFLAETGEDVSANDRADTINSAFRAGHESLKSLLIFSYEAHIAAGGTPVKKEPEKLIRGGRNPAVVAASAEVDRAFRDWVTDISCDRAELQTWYDTVRRIVTAAMNEIIDGANPKALFIGKKVENVDYLISTSSIHLYAALNRHAPRIPESEVVEITEGAGN